MADQIKFGSMAVDRSFREFEAERLAEGFDLVVERTWAPGTVVEEHTHDFAAKALIIRGEMWLTVGDLTRFLSIGDTFELGERVPHRERYGHNGAVYWVARRGTA